ncbi:MAG: hypothetical protein GWN99_05275 [Gemmatimonadetes bacterium]|uniref:Lipoprotein n=1 Tax=Candidatus Kutchimonas denitrificans TaxID=3056748 RepID=A0AAE5CBN3_9BACT|nr:hypothetical protein [Gemmatimonadota bacterium]NIR76097.1 hypothetical protein [Candidatus Kutchimonas denitrificans]NIS00476.1 hypothetical protein [Gemmatimonadota bacterium]NIT66134.1 hypothetical protein [Gemmatimonadota bacterium]NIU54212.1 hypothetical protein [Gemmatimonadota bacterium]
MPTPRHYVHLPLLAVLLLGCGESNFEPVAARPLEPPSTYRIWWGEVQECVGAWAPFGRIRWYEAEQIHNIEAGTDHRGAWKPPHSIYIDSEWVSFEPVVKHEMVHELLQRRDHDSLFFQACAGL